VWALEMVGNAELRRALDEATSLVVVQQYRDEIERLRGMFGHSITVLADDDVSGAPRPTCYAFAFGLTGNPRYQQLLMERRDRALTPLNSGLVQRFLSTNELWPRIGPPEPDDVVLYSDNGNVRHGGIVMPLEGMFRSKWGPAEVHEHAMWEVPLSYGETAVIYHAPDPIRILTLIEQG